MTPPARSLLGPLCIVVAVGSTLLYWLAPLSLKGALWTHEVLENWNQYGLWALKGKLVWNPGGAGALSEPLIYAGHSPILFYVAFFLKKAAGPLGGWLFFLLLTLVVALSIFFLLGRSRFGFLAACAAMLSMGYARTTLILDPVTIPVSVGLLYTVIAIKFLGQKQVSVWSWLAFALATSLYAVLNWTTAFVFGILAGFFWVWLRDRPLRWLGFVLIAGVGVLAVGGLLYSQKAASGTGAERPFSDFYNHYLIGPIGYDGAPMTWTRAVVRLGAATVIGLLPLLLLYTWQFWKSGAWRRFASLSCVLPLVFAVAAVAGMRNYFAHHPWMAPPVIIVGIVLSMRLLRAGAVDEPVVSPMRADFSFAGASLVYACFLAIASGLNIQQDAIIHLVRGNTERTDAIAYSAQRDPWIVPEHGRLEEVCDREFVEIRNLAPPRGACFFTAKEYPPPARWKARTVATDSRLQMMVEKLLAAYRTHIARRKQGARLEVPTCYLYEIREVSDAVAAEVGVISTNNPGSLSVK